MVRGVCLFHWKLEASQIKNVRYRGFLAGACASGCLLHLGFENTSSLQTIPHTVGDEVIGLGSGPGRWDSSEL